MNTTTALNSRAWRLVDRILEDVRGRRLEVRRIAGARVVDCGVGVLGGLELGLDVARVCLSDLGRVSIHPGEVEGVGLPYVQVTTDEPVRACLASQYAGWKLAAGDFFAMGSGPMRAARGRESLYDRIGGREDSERVVGVLESGALPSAEIVGTISEECRVDPTSITLMVAPTSSLVGGLQVVARSVETAIHKLFHLGFDVESIVSAVGVAPLPPVAKTDLEAIGRTNDAILYGGRVTLYLDADDGPIEEVGEQVPSASSDHHGEPFLTIFERAGRDFYAIDPLLFSPAQVGLQSLRSGRLHAHGTTRPDLLARSFFANRDKK